MASFGRSINVGEYAENFSDLNEERLKLFYEIGQYAKDYNDLSNVKVQALPGSSRMILEGQTGFFHSQLFEPTGPLLAPARTLGTGVTLYEGIDSHFVDVRTRDFSNGGDRWHTPQDESRLKAIRATLGGNTANGEGFWRVSGTPAHPPNSLRMLPETSPIDRMTPGDDNIEGYLRMETGLWDTTRAHPNNSMRNQEFNVSDLMHSRMLMKALMPEKTLNTEGESKVMTQGPDPAQRAPGRERPQNDAAVQLNAFGVIKQLPWPAPGVQTYTAGGVPLAPSVQARYPRLSEEESPPKPYDFEYQRLSNQPKRPSVPVPELPSKDVGRPWEREFLRTRWYHRLHRQPRDPYARDTYDEALRRNRTRTLFGLPNPHNPIGARAPPQPGGPPAAPAVAPADLPPPGRQAAAFPNGSSVQPPLPARRPPVNSLPRITPSGATGRAAEAQNNLYGPAQIPNENGNPYPGHSGSGKPHDEPEPFHFKGGDKPSVGVGAHTEADASMRAQAHPQKNLHPSYTLRYGGEFTDKAKMKNPDSEEEQEKPEHEVADSMAELYAQAETEALSSGLPLVLPPATTAPGNVSGQRLEGGSKHPFVKQGMEAGFKTPSQFASHVLSSPDKYDKAIVEHAHRVNALRGGGGQLAENWSDFATNFRNEFENPHSVTRTYTVPAIATAAAIAAFAVPAFAIPAAILGGLDAASVLDGSILEAQAAHARGDKNAEAAAIAWGAANGALGVAGLGLAAHAARAGAAGAKAGAAGAAGANAAAGGVRAGEAAAGVRAGEAAAEAGSAAAADASQIVRGTPAAGSAAEAAAASKAATAGKSTATGIAELDALDASLSAQLAASNTAKGTAAGTEVAHKAAYTNLVESLRALPKADVYGIPGRSQYVNGATYVNGAFKNPKPFRVPTKAEQAAMDAGGAVPKGVVNPKDPVAVKAALKELADLGSLPAQRALASTSGASPATGFAGIMGELDALEASLDAGKVGAPASTATHSAASTAAAQHTAQTIAEFGAVPRTEAQLATQAKNLEKLQATANKLGKPMTEGEIRAFKALDPRQEIEFMHHAAEYGARAGAHAPTPAQLDRTIEELNTLRQVRGNPPLTAAELNTIRQLDAEGQTAFMAAADAALTAGDAIRQPIGDVADIPVGREMNAENTYTVASVSNAYLDWAFQNAGITDRYGRILDTDRARYEEQRIRQQAEYDIASQLEAENKAKVDAANAKAAAQQKAYNEAYKYDSAGNLIENDQTKQDKYTGYIKSLDRNVYGSESETLYPGLTRYLQQMEQQAGSQDQMMYDMMTFPEYYHTILLGLAPEQELNRMGIVFPPPRQGEEASTPAHPPSPTSIGYKGGGHHEARQYLRKEKIASDPYHYEQAKKFYMRRKRLTGKGDEEQGELNGGANTSFNNSKALATVSNPKSFTGKGEPEEKLAGSGLEAKLAKLLEHHEKKEAKRAAKRARELPTEAKDGAQRMVSFLK